MSIPLSVNAPVAAFSVVGSEAAPPGLSAQARALARERASLLRLACRDVMDEIHARVTRLGYSWD